MEQENKDLLAYMKQAIKLESSIVEQNMLIDDFRSVSDRRKPELVQKDLIDVPNPYPAIEANRRMFKIALIVGIVVFFFMMLIAGKAIGPGFIVGIGVGGMFIAIGIPSLVRKNRMEKEYLDEINKVNEENDRIIEENKAAKVEYEKEFHDWEKTDKAVKEYMRKPLVETKRVLDKYYSLDKIYPKYRTLPALTSIYEYLDSGRCEGLTGPHGAYNLYEDELRKDTIIAQLNTIINDLEQIKQNQYLLYQEMRHILANTQKISDDMEHIKFNTKAILGLAELSAYYNGVTAANTVTLALYEALR